MNTPSASIRDRARRLLAVEAANESTSHPRAHEAVRVCEKLRISLTRFAGADGFTSLLRRALALARAEVPALQTRQGQRPTAHWKDLKNSSPMRRTAASRRRPRSPRICWGCWSLSSANPSRCVWCARPGPTFCPAFCWTNNLRNRGWLMSNGQNQEHRTSNHSATAHRRAGPR